MVSVFPYLFSWSEISPFILRLTIGAVFLFWAYRYFKGKMNASNKAVSLVEAAIGAMFIVGLWTQIAAIAAMIDLAIRLIDKMRSKMFLTDGLNYYLILFVIALSLLFLGAGAFAIDYRI